MPLAVTDNLNFGNPYKPANFWQLRECVEGLAESCREFATPVIGGNVSLYNESPAGVVDPTPTVAMVGLISDERHITRQFFKSAGDVIILLGDLGDELGASHFMKVCHGRKEGLPPRLSFEREIAVQKALRSLIHSGLVKSAHDCSEGGLAVALAESCFNPEQRLGAAVTLQAHHLRADVTLFNESQSRVVISVSPQNAARVLEQLQSEGVSGAQIGTVGGDKLSIDTGASKCEWELTQLFDDWYSSIERAISAG